MSNIKNISQLESLNSFLHEMKRENDNPMVNYHNSNFRYYQKPKSDSLFVIFDCKTTNGTDSFMSLACYREIDSTGNIRNLDNEMSTGQKTFLFNQLNQIEL